MLCLTRRFTLRVCAGCDDGNGTTSPRLRKRPSTHQRGSSHRAALIDALGRPRIPAEVGHEKLLFNFSLDDSAGCSVSPVRDLSLHFLCPVFGRSEFHGKLVRKTHSAIQVFFREVGRRSNLRNVAYPVNRRWNGTPYRRSKGTPLSGEF